MISWTAEHAQANMNSPTWAEHGQPSIDSRTSNCFALKKEQTPDKGAARSYIHTYIQSYSRLAAAARLHIANLCVEGLCVDYCRWLSDSP